MLSDGGGRIDANTQQKIKDWFDRLHLSLYWIVLHQPGGISIFDTNFKPVEDRALPAEIELYEFFKTFKTPFKAYEAEDPKSLQLAMNDINNREKKPIKYYQKIAGTDYSNACFIIAAIMISLLLGAATQGVEPGLPIPVVITAFADKSFTFVMKSPPATVLIKKAAGITKGSPRPHTDKVGKITRAQAEDIVKTKQADLSAADMDAAVRTIAGSARSMGIEVEGV